MVPPGLLSPCTSIKGVFLMVYLLGSTRCSETESNCVCPDISPWPKTQPAPSGCFQNGSMFRYKCIDGYVRKAGTSNLIRCNGTGWSKPSLECIVNPLNPPTKTTTTTFPTSTMTPSLGLLSSMSTEVEHLETPSTVRPPPRTSVSPSMSPAPSSLPVTPESFQSTSTLSSPTTTNMKSRRLDMTTSPSRLSLSSTPSALGAEAVATKVIAPLSVGVIVLAVIGAVWLLCRRKSTKSFPRIYRGKETSEECVPMQQNGGMM